MTSGLVGVQCGKALPYRPQPLLQHTAMPHFKMERPAAERTNSRTGTIKQILATPDSGKAGIIQLAAFNYAD